MTSEQLDDLERLARAMTSEQLDELERLARAASRGPWEWYAGTTLLSPDAQVLAIDLPEFICDEDKAYLAAANPDAVLALIARVRGLEAEPVFRDVSEMEPPDGGSGPAFGQSGMAYWRERALEAEAERDRLAAEVELLDRQIAYLNGQVARQADEIAKERHLRSNLGQQP